jgi:8-oxo-dGTP pyrophosphatase MutT (NUDIX family)
LRPGFTYDERMMGLTVGDAIAARLDPNPRPTTRPGDRHASVVALVIETPEPSILFTERAPGLSRHAGELSFPGGLQEPQDDGPAGTAVRETFEEIGLAGSAYRLLGALSPVHTFVSGILVTPFVGVIGSLPALTVSDAEIARVLTVPIPVLVGAEEERELHREGGRVWKGWWYEVQGVTVWGATGFMLRELLQLLREEAPWLIQPS